MDTPARFAALYDEAQSEAKRFGGEPVNPFHVAVAWARRTPGWLDEAGRAQLVSVLRERSLGQVDGALGVGPDAVRLILQTAAEAASPDEELGDLLLGYLRAAFEVTEADDGGDLGANVGAGAATELSGGAGLRADLDRSDDHQPVAAEVTSDADHAIPSSLHPASGRQRSGSGANPATADDNASRPPVVVPDGLTRFASVLVGAPIVGRRQEILELAAATLRTDACLPMVVGPRGVGRSAVLRGFAEYLNSDEAPDELRGHGVVVVSGAALLRAERGGTIRRLLDHVSGDHILVLDGIELMCAFTGPNPDPEVLGVLRSLASDREHRVVGVLDSRYLSSLTMSDSSLEALLHIVEVRELPQSEIKTVALAEITAIAEYHGVSVGDAVIEIACAAAKSDTPIAQPGLAVQRIQIAAARATAQGRREVEVGDLDLAGRAAGPTRLDIRTLRANLERQIVGQVGAVDRMVDRLALTQAQMDLYPHRPDGVFLFLGPTGVGKTALARAISEELFGLDSLIRLDMSEYAQEWAIARLIGPQPGYVGYTEPQGWLTTRVREHSRSVVLLDEIEKAHPRVWNTFLQVFDAGRLTDARGNVADFSNAVVIMTSNVGAEAFTKSTVGFRAGPDQQEVAERVLEQLRDTMSPELINRIDEVAVFRPLSVDDIVKITEIEVARAANRLKDRGYLIGVSAEVLSHLGDTGYDQRYGARHVQRNIERLLLQSLVEHEPGSWTATLEGGSIAWVST